MTDPVPPPTDASAPRPTQRLSVQSSISAFGTNAVFSIAKVFPGLMEALIPSFVRIAWWTTPKLRDNTMANARRLLGADAPLSRRKRLARRMIAGSCRFVVDLSRGGRRNLEQLFDAIETIEGSDHYDAAREAQKGLIVATAHLGSYEVGLAALRQRESDVHVVFQRDPLPRFEALRRNLHERLGVHEVPVDDGMETWVRLRDALERNEVVVMQADRVMPGQKGRPVEFFDGHLELPLGPLKLAKLTGAPILPIFAINRGRGKVRIVIEPAVEVNEDGRTDESCLQQIGASIQRVVQAHPQQWMVLEKAWLEDQAAVE